MPDFKAAIDQAADPLASCRSEVERVKAVRQIADHRIQVATRQVIAGIKQEYPEASSLMLHGRTGVAVRQPPELHSHLAAIIGRLLTEPDTHKVSNKAWTEELNQVFGNRYNPATFFSKTRLGSKLRAKLNGVMAQRGLPPFPAGCDTLAKAAKVAKAARLGTADDAQPFADGIGKVARGQLQLGSRAFTVEPQHHGHDCIRFNRPDGTRGRMRLADLEQVLTGSGLGSAGGTLYTYSTRVVGELAPEAETDPLELSADQSGANSPVFSPIPLHPAGASSPDNSPSLIVAGASDCIYRLVAGRAQRAAADHARAAELASLQARGIDPLEL